MKKFFSLLLIVLLFHACSNEEPNSEKTGNNINFKTVEPKWEFETSQDENFNPRTTIYILIENFKIKLVENAPGGFEPIQTKQYEMESIPKTAITACSGFWAGLFQVLYIERADDKLIIYEGFLDAEVDEELTFKKKTEITQADFQ